VTLGGSTILRPKINLKQIASEDSQRQCRRVPLAACSVCIALTDYFIDEFNKASGCVQLDASSCSLTAQPITIRCFHGIALDTCSTPMPPPPAVRCENDCSEHGSCISGVCECDRGFTGSSCSESTHRAVPSPINHVH